MKMSTDRWFNGGGGLWVVGGGRWELDKANWQVKVSEDQTRKSQAITDRRNTSLENVVHGSPEGGHRLFTSICLEQTPKQSTCHANTFFPLLLCPHWDESRPRLSPTIIESHIQTQLGQRSLEMTASCWAPSLEKMERCTAHKPASCHDNAACQTPQIGRIGYMERGCVTANFELHHTTHAPHTVKSYKNNETQYTMPAWHGDPVGLIRNIIMQSLMYYLVLERSIAQPHLLFLCCRREQRWSLHPRFILVHVHVSSGLDSSSEAPMDQISFPRLFYPKDAYCT